MYTTSAEIINVTPQTLLNVKMSNVTKLSPNNYLMWSIQIQALLDGYDFSGHLDGSLPPPSPTITTDGVTTPNPAYTIRKRQNRLIYIGLIGAINPTIQPMFLLQRLL